MEGNLWFILKLLPYLAFCCIVSGFVGWTLRAHFGTTPEPQAKTTPKPQPRKTKR